MDELQSGTASQNRRTENLSETDAASPKLPATTEDTNKVSGLVSVIDDRDGGSRPLWQPDARERSSLLLCCRC